MVKRRDLLKGSAVALGAAGAGWAVHDTVRPDDRVSGFGDDVVEFHGVHQAGIQTSPQAHALFIALDLRDDTDRDARETFVAVLKLWSADAARLTEGAPALADTEPELSYRPARLTVTVGFGPTVFDRIGLAQHRPASARELPGFEVDRLEPRWCGGDLLLQICADDPMVLAHAARVLVKNVRSLTLERWRQPGFRTARGADVSGTTMRNLMGQIDGTVNPDPRTSDFDELVWDDGQTHPWLAGGTLVVIRRIEMKLDTWDELDRHSRELTVGRRLDNGAPLTGDAESDEPDLTIATNGIPVIPPNAHIALAHHRSPAERFLRRPYNYDEPPGPGRTSNSGLIFVTYQRDIDAQFLPVQQRLAEFDALNQWTTAIGSAVFVVPPGVPADGADGYVGQSLLGR